MRPQPPFFPFGPVSDRIAQARDYGTGLIKLICLGLCVGIMAGLANALFLHGLDLVTLTRMEHHWLVYLLPIAGFVTGWAYLHYGAGTEKGNDLLIEEIHEPKQIVPFRMAPLILIATWISHLSGASVGREGTAVQISGSLADRLTKWLRLDAENRRLVLIAGIAAGFSAVFGTPLAGAVFGIEVLSVGRLRSDAVFPSLVAAIVAHRVMLSFGVAEPSFPVGAIPDMGATVFLDLVFAGILFGLAGGAFVKLHHFFSRAFNARIPYAPLRPFLGGAIIALLFAFLPVGRYLGLGSQVVADAFTGPVRPWDFAGKLFFTTFSLGSGLKGGEVTPLFFIGATLGNALAPLSRLPLPFMTALGFVAVFAGASNTPLTCIILAMEYFGSQMGVPAGVVCVVAYLFSGRRGLYHAQRPEGIKWRGTPYGHV